MTTSTKTKATNTNTQETMTMTDARKDLPLEIRSQLLKTLQSKDATQLRDLIKHMRSEGVPVPDLRKFRTHAKLVALAYRLSIQYGADEIVDAFKSAIESQPESFADMLDSDPQTQEDHKAQLEACARIDAEMSATTQETVVEATPEANTTDRLHIFAVNTLTEEETEIVALQEDNDYLDRKNIALQQQVADLKRELELTREQIQSDREQDAKIADQQAVIASLRHTVKGLAHERRILATSLYSANNDLEYLEDVNEELTAKLSTATTATQGRLQAIGARLDSFFAFVWLWLVTVFCGSWDHVKTAGRCIRDNGPTGAKRVGMVALGIVGVFCLPIALVALPLVPVGLALAVIVGLIMEHRQQAPATAQ